jgi:hypothetical protein
LIGAVDGGGRVRYNVCMGDIGKPLRETERPAPVPLPAPERPEVAPSPSRPVTAPA